jgi:L-lactate permease
MTMEMRAQITVAVPEVDGRTAILHGVKVGISQTKAMRAPLRMDGSPVALGMIGGPVRRSGALLGIGLAAEGRIAGLIEIHILSRKAMRTTLRTDGIPLALHRIGSPVERNLAIGIGTAEGRAGPIEIHEAMKVMRVAPRADGSRLATIGNLTARSETIGIETIGPKGIAGLVQTYMAMKARRSWRPVKMWRIPSNQHGRLPPRGRRRHPSP